MPAVVPAPDRRAALKDRHRRAIIDAAAALLTEQGGAGFTVDDLAARADVSRRTVFNHFASVDDIVTSVCADVLSGVLDAFVVAASAAPAAAGSPSPAMFDEVAHAMRSTDLVTPMAYLTRTLGSPEEGEPWRTDLQLRTVHDVSERLCAAMAARHPEAELLDVELLVSSLVPGLVVLYRHWFAATRAADDEASRQVWAALVDRLVDTARAGFDAPTRR